MSGTATGGRLAAKKNKNKHGEDFYKRIGAIGGQKSRTGGFFANRELARRAGSIGGRVSRRS
jgi:general stress protein YciG